MALPIWIADALRSEQAPLKQTFWRCVEAQHVISTMKLVDTADEQAMLEDILEQSKPPVPPECEGLHYLYMTPFRYSPYPHGSRFRRAGQTKGVFYASEKQQIAMMETAFYALLFYAESPDTPFPDKSSQYSAFDVPVKCDAAINLTQPRFNELSDIWTDLLDYAPCQTLEEMAREQGVEAIGYYEIYRS